ncbi:MAG: hypothetical protein HY927_10160 [Elusimicrobia bacterium]|nr:hypothetical protein [Elusimicrobiota bacterium]
MPGPLPQGTAALRRVAVTGLGVLSPVGRGKERFWEALLAGRTAFSPVESFDTAGWRTSIGAEIKDFEPRTASAFAMEACREALGDAGLGDAGRDASWDAARTGVALGTTSGEATIVDGLMRRRSQDGASAAAAAFAAACLEHGPASVPAAVARSLGLGGPNAMLTTACAAGNFALSWAYDKVAEGRADAMLAGGVDVFWRLSYAGFSRLLAIAARGCTPFSKGRGGLIPAEGCGVLVLEDWERAAARGARVYAEMLGYGASSDAFHVTMPSVEGVGRAIRACLDACGLRPEDVDYISAHGTGTHANDRTETAAIKAVLGERARSVPVSSIKSMLGHAMGAASALEAVASCLAIRTGDLPPTAGFTGGDPDCDLDYVPNVSRRADPEVVLSNAFAFGGANCVVAFAKPRPGERPGPTAQGPAAGARARAFGRVVVTGLAELRGGHPRELAERLLPDKDLSFIDEPVAWALAAAKLSLDDAGLEASKAGAAAGIILDSTGETESQYLFFEELDRGGPLAVEPRQFPTILANAAAARAAIALGLRLVVKSFGGGFPGGEDAVADAFDLVRRDQGAVVVAGGVGRGAGLLVLESLDAALGRGARIYAEIIGYDERFALGGRNRPPGAAGLVEAVRGLRDSGLERAAVPGCGLFGGEIAFELGRPPGEGARAPAAQGGTP